MAGQSESAKRLKALRERTGLSVDAVAKRLNRKKSSYAYYEDGYKKPHLPVELINALIPVLTPYGVEESEMVALTALAGRAKRSPISTENPNESLTNSRPPLPVETTGGEDMYDRKLLRIIEEAADLPPEYLVRLKHLMDKLVQQSGTPDSKESGVSQSTGDDSGTSSSNESRSAVHSSIFD